MRRIHKQQRLVGMLPFNESNCNHLHRYYGKLDQIRNIILIRRYSIERQELISIHVNYHYSEIITPYVIVIQSLNVRASGAMLH